MSMVDKNLTTEMFEFNSLSQFSIALFIINYTMADGLVIYLKAKAFKAKAIYRRQRLRSDNPMARKFGHKAKTKAND